MANNVDPDQMLWSTVSDLGLHCLLSLPVPIFRKITVCSLFYRDYNVSELCHILDRHITSVNRARLWDMVKVCSFASSRKYGLEMISK